MKLKIQSTAIHAKQRSHSYPEILTQIHLVIHKADHVTVGPDWTKNVFPYPYCRIYVITSGSAELKTHGHTIPLKPYYMYLLPEFIMEKTVCTSFLSQYYIHFQIGTGPEKEFFDYFKPKIMVKTEPFNDIIKLCETIQENFAKNNIQAYLKSQGAIRLLLAAFCKDSPHGFTQSNRFSTVVQYIDENPAKKILVSDLAKLIGLEPIYFSTLFSKTFGIPPGQYILNNRLKKAQIMLIETDEYIKEIAFKIGFESEM